MGTATDAARPVKAKKVSLCRTVPSLVRDPLRAFETISAQAGGDVVRLDLGLFAPLLVTRPEHVQEVLHAKPSVYSRDGMLWDPLRRLFGNGLASEGATWQPHRRMVQPMFSAKQFTPHIDEMTATIAASVDGLDRFARSGKPLDVGTEMTRIVHRALVRVLFGDKIASRDADQLTASIEKAFTSLGPRLLLPFVPNSFPLPGDGAFRRAARRINRVMLPLVRDSRERGAEPDPVNAAAADIVDLVSGWRDTNGDALDDQQVRDDLILMFVGGSETTAVALTWLFTALGRHPDVAAKLYREIDEVVGAGPVEQAHLPRLTYTRMVIQETLRLYPVGWLIPRTATRPDSIGGVRVWRGDTVMLSPYLTHRLAGVWDRPLAFDPDRFTPENSAGRHRFAYFPFGGGPHHCVGSHFFTVEAQVVVATLLSRYRPLFSAAATVTPQPRATLRPRQRVRMGLRPLAATVAGRAG